MITAYGEILFDVYPNSERLGGAPFNFTYHITKLTGNGKIISRIGADDHGTQIQHFLKSCEIDTHLIQVDERCPTGTAVVELDENGIPRFTITEDVAYDHIEPDHEARDLIGSSDMFYFGTLIQRSYESRETLYHYCSLAQKCFVDVNLRQNYYSKSVLHRSFEYADIVKVNDDELKEIYSLFFEGPYELAPPVRQLMKEYSISCVAVTMGNKGSWLFSAATEKFHKTTAANVIDTVGAGDGFSAMMCIGLQKGWSLEKTNKIASEFSAEICTIEGALPSDDTFYEKYRQLIS